MVSFSSRVKIAKRLGRSVDDIEDAPSSSFMAARSAVFLSSLNNNGLSLGRDANDVASGLSPVQPMNARALINARPLSRVSPVIRSELTEFEDNRFYTPDPIFKVRTTRRIQRLKAGVPGAIYQDRKNRMIRKKAHPFWAIRAPDILHAFICVKRKARREVLFAKGKGGGGHARPKWKQASSVWC